MSRQINNIQDVVEGQLCTGCGACSYMEPRRFEMSDALELGRRPFVKNDAAAETGRALKICPGIKLEHDYNKNNPKIRKELQAGWGPVFEVWEGYAADDTIRKAGSSGGAATALSLYALEKSGMHGVLHTAGRKDIPYLNETVLSETREQLVAATGSRYSPASPCEKLEQVKSAPGKCAFVGKPCDVAAVRNIRRLDPELDEKIGITIGFFCAGTPSTMGTLKLLENNGIPSPRKLTKLRFRGNGWPGLWTADYGDEKGQAQKAELTYADSWGFLQKYRQWRCYICPDHTGELADVSVGDPWYREVDPGELGKSLIVARTEEGKEFILAAAKAGYITLEKNDAGLLPASQPNLLKTRGSLWARLIVLSLLGAATPKYLGFKTFRYWWEALSLKNKLQSFFETSKRVFKKNLHRRIEISPWKPDDRG